MKQRAKMALPWGSARLSESAQQRYLRGEAYCEKFFMHEAEVQRARAKLTNLLETEGIPYAIIGGLALNEYGHRRATVDVDVILREEDLRKFKRKFLGKGYVERVPGTGKLLDTEHGVRIDVLSAGRFPGDDRPKPIRFPDPSTCAVRGEGFALLPLPRFVELKLASGMTAPHRLRDLADIIDLIRSASIPRGLVGELDPWVREKFNELWEAAQAEDPYS